MLEREEIGPPTRGESNPAIPKSGSRVLRKRVLPNLPSDPAESGGSGGWVLEQLNHECASYMINDVLAPSIATCALERDGMEARSASIAVGVNGLALGSVLQTSTPLLAAFTKTSFQVVMCCMSMVWLMQGLWVLRARTGIPTTFEPLVHTREVRFVPLELRDGTRKPDILAPGIDSFGLAVDGAPGQWRHVANATLAVNGSEILFRSPTAVPFNGWWYKTSLGDPAKDPVSFEVLARLDDVECSSCGNRGAGGAGGAEEAEWVRVGASGWFRTWVVNIDVFGTARSSRVPLERFELTVCDTSTDRGALVLESGGSLACAISLALAVVVVRRSKEDDVALHFAVTCCSIVTVIRGVHSIFRGSAFVEYGYTDLGGVLISIGVVYLVFGLFLPRIQRHFRVLFCTTAIGNPILSVLNIKYRDGSLLLLQHVIYLAISLSLGGIVVATTATRMRLVSFAKKIMQDDENTYNAIWRDVCAAVDADPAESDALAVISKLTDGVNRGRDPAEVRQLLRATQASEQRGRGLSQFTFGTGGYKVFPSHIASNGSDGQHEPSFNYGNQGVRRPSRLQYALSQEMDSPETVSETTSGEIQVQKKNVVNVVSSFEQRPKGSNMATTRDLECGWTQSDFSRDKSSGWRPNVQPQDSSVTEIIMGPATFRFNSIMGAVDGARPVRSLDQLYLQAQNTGEQKERRPDESGVRKELSGLDFETTFESWRLVAASQEEGDTQNGGVRWTAIKSLDRATQKVMRSYVHDCSRLLDICRESVIFERVSDLAQCLQLICEDHNFVVLRVKNRMERESDSSDTCGYRCVSVNFRIVTELTIKLGVDTHVCELQLLLLPFARLKSASSHKRYIQFRDMRGE